MGYIIVWRNGYREPFVEVDSHNFKETYSTYEQAKESAKATIEAEGKDSEWYFDYKIYEEVNS
jgi:hypothetical protein